MSSLQGKSAVVIGGSSGVGKATVKALISEGVRVTAVARDADRLRGVEAEVGDGLATLQGDATVPAFVDRLLRELKPDLVVRDQTVEPQTFPGVANRHGVSNSLSSFAPVIRTNVTPSAFDRKNPSGEILL